MASIRGTVASLAKLVVSVGALWIGGLLGWLTWGCGGEHLVGVTGCWGAGIEGGRGDDEVRRGEGVARGLTSTGTFSALGERGVRGFGCCWDVVPDCRMRRERRGCGWRLSVWP